MTKRQARGLGMILLVALCLGLVTHALHAEALHAEEPLARGDVMIRKTLRSSHIPAVAVGMYAKGVQTYASYENKGVKGILSSQDPAAGGNMSIDENSLFFIGSLSKSFTAHAVLLLAERGVLSLGDAVTDHIPFFEASWQGEDVSKDITLAHLLYQTSGFTNEEKRFPNAEPDMTLEENVRNLSGRALEFRPGERYAYANANYNILGYVIERTSGLSYEAFMETEVFVPLGLDDTTADKDAAGGTRVGGTRSFFFNAIPYHFPVSRGTVPAGYLLSTTGDLGRWLQMHLGQLPVPADHAAAIQKAHVAHPVSVVDENTRYAAGWFVDMQARTLHHSGGTPNYSTRMVLHPNSASAVCVLTNMNASANTEDIANNLMRLLQGNQDMVYRRDVWTVVDAIFSTLVVLCLLLTVMVCRRVKRGTAGTVRKRWAVLPVCLLSLMGVFVFVFPLSFGSPWNKLLVWTPPSLPLGVGLAVGCAIIMLIHIFRQREPMVPSK